MASRPTSTASCCRPTGRDSRRSAAAPCAGCRPWPMPACARPSTVPRRSPRTTSSSSANRRFAASSWPPGFSAHGIAGAGGLGRQVAHWIVDGEPPLDLWKMDIRRFGAQYRTRAFTLARSIENYATYYDIHYPNEERQAARGRCAYRPRTPADRAGCAFGEKSGWERPNWFEANAAAGDEALRPRGWAGRHWSPAIGAEALATRSAAALFDETSFAKIEISGPGRAGLPPGPVRQRHGPGRRPHHLHPDAEPARRDRVRLHGDPPGRGSVLHRHRHRLRQPRPRLDPPPRSRGRQRDRDRCHLRPGLPGHLGPRARDIVVSRDRRRLVERRLPVHDRPTDDHRSGAGAGAAGDLCRRAGLGAVLRRRSTGWRCGTRCGQAGQPHGLVAGGYRAIDALRLEKGYRVWSSDITPEDTPVSGRAWRLPCG